MEYRQPFAINHDEYRELKEEKLNYLIQLRRGEAEPSRQSSPGFISPAAEPSYDVDEETLIKGLQERGFKISNIVAVAEKDKFSIELNVIAAILTYFEVAVRRISDYIPMFIEHEFLRKFGEKLKTELPRNLGLDGKNGEKICEAILKDDREYHIRKALIAKRDAFRNALETWKY